MGGNEMSNPTKNEAAKSTVDFELSTAENNGASGNGLTSENTLVQSDHVGEKARACGIIVSPRRMMRYGGRSPYDYWRIAAAPSFSQARGVSFGTFGNFLPSGSNLIRTFAKNFANAIRKHGIVASIDFMGAPCGELSSSPFPIERYFLHLHGAARPVGRADGFDNLSIGAPAMTLHDAASVHAHAHTVGASSLRAFLSILSCGNIRLPARMSGCGFSRPLNIRRISAAPRFYARGFSFGPIPFTGEGAPACVIRYPGRIAPTDFVMGTPGGKPSGLPFPDVRSANPPGVARPLAGVCGSNNSTSGNSAMTHHDAASVHAHAHTIGASSLRSFLSILSCGNIRLPARMSGRRLGGLLKQRRMTAAPCFSKARGVSFKVSTFPGVDAPSSVIRHPGRIVPSEFVMGAPGGELSSSPLPLLRSANLPGVAHLLAEVSGFSNPNRGNSAMTHHDAASVHAHAHTIGASSLRAFFSRVSCGNIRLPRRMTGCRLGGLLKRRRITAAPRLYARGFSFGAIPCTGSNAPARGIRYPGRIALNDFMMSAPGGKPSGLPLPTLRSANLPGVALLLAEERGKDNSNVGNPGMNLHVTEGAPSRALNLGVCKLLNLINRLTGRAGGVRPRGSYPGVDLGMHIPSIFELNPELLELAHAEALKHSQGVRHE